MLNKKKPESILVIFWIILAWIYGKLPKIPKLQRSVVTVTFIVCG